MRRVMLEDMILTKDMPSAAGSRMLAGYVSPFDATVVEKLREGGFEIAGKLPVGEFGIDLVGETCYEKEGAYAAANALKTDTVMGVIALDVNGAPRRVAAQKDLVCLKPTYGTVSRYGTVAVASSADTVGVLARSAADCGTLFATIATPDARDTTMQARKPVEGRVQRVAVLPFGADAAVTAKMDAAKGKMCANGIEICEAEAGVIATARACWNTLLCAELSANLSRFDGIKYGHRSASFATLEQLYTESRSEGLGLLVKSAILYGSDVLYGENYEKKYQKALRVRRVIAEAFRTLFAEYDAVLLPASSKLQYTETDHPFAENLYTAPASLTGLPAVVADGVQLIGPAFSEERLLAVATLLEEVRR